MTKPLRLLVDLLLIAPRLAWAWLKTKLPSRKARLRCSDCGWCLPWDTASLLCHICQRDRETQATMAAYFEAQEHKAQVPVSKLFCCDVDLEYLGSRPGGAAIDYRYRCPPCGRIWLYIVEWHKDSGSEADWYPQRTADERATSMPPPLFDERTRTKVYEVKP